MRDCSEGLHCIKSSRGSTQVLGLSLSFSLSLKVNPSSLLSPLCPLNSKMNRGDISQESKGESISDRAHLLSSYQPREGAEVRDRGSKQIKVNVGKNSLMKDNETQRTKTHSCILLTLHGRHIVVLSIKTKENMCVPWDHGSCCLCCWAATIADENQMWLRQKLDFSCGC